MAIALPPTVRHIRSRRRSLPVRRRAAASILAASAARRDGPAARGAGAGDRATASAEPAWGIGDGSANDRRARNVARARARPAWTAPATAAPWRRTIARAGLSRAASIAAMDGVDIRGSGCVATGVRIAAGSRSSAGAGLPRVCGCAPGISVDAVLVSAGGWDGAAGIGAGDALGSGTRGRTTIADAAGRTAG